MIFSNKEIRNDYLSLLQEIIKNELTKELIELLNKFNFVIKIEQHIDYLNTDINVENFSDQNTISYLYKGSLYDELEIRKNLVKTNLILSTKERAEKFYEISQKFIFLYRKGHLKKLEEKIFDTHDIIEIQWVKGDDITKEEILSMIGHGPFFDWQNVVYNLLSFSIDGVQVFELGGNRYYTGNDVEYEAYNKEYFYNAVRSKTDIINVTEMEWFPNLSDKSRNLVVSGNQYLNKIFSGNSDDQLDYSPLLLNFSKALEMEIKEYYKKYYSLIVPMAELIVKNDDFIRECLIKEKDKNRYRINNLLSLSREIHKFKANYFPSGFKPLPYILYYFGLGKEIDKIINVHGFLDTDEFNRVERELALIEKLFSISNNRNRYIHDISIESKNEFLMYYYDIYLALKLIVEIK